MPISQREIYEYKMKAMKNPNAHCVLVVCDMFDWTDYCVIINKDESIKEKIREYDNRQNMSKVMEVHHLYEQWDE